MYTNSEFSISKPKFDVFQSANRNLYTILALQLMKEPLKALQIMALWLWMQGNRFIDTVEKINDLPLELINGLADEAVVCINFLKNGLVLTPAELYNSIPLLHFLMKKELSLLFCGDNRISAIDGIKKIFSDVCLITLGDLYSEAIKVHEAVKRSLVEKQIAQISRSFTNKVGLGAADGDDLSSHGAGGSSNSGHIGFGHGSSSLLQSGSSSSSNLGQSNARKLGVGLLNSDALGLGLDPIKVVVPGPPVSPYGYVGMGRGSAFTNRALDPPCSLTTSRSKPNFGVIGPPPRLAASNSFNDAPAAAPKMIQAPNQRSSSYFTLNHHHHHHPAMGVGPALVPHHFTVPDDTLLPPEQRTLFVTFSKGYRVNERELREFITLCFGDCIDSLSMQETHGDEQPLFARVVFNRPETIDAVLNGEDKAKFTINGKHVWARKFVPKNPRSFLRL